MRMKSSTWFRALAVVFGIFTLGHTLGTLPKIKFGQQEIDVVNAMQSFRFPIMGFTRSYWEFYRGFSITISVLLAALMLFAWQVASLSRRSPRNAMSFALTLVLVSVANTIVSIEYFFSGPIVMSLAAVVVSTVALFLLRREATEPASSFAPLRATA